MSWNYRIIEYEDRKGFGLHEVFYDDDGFLHAYGETPAGFVCDADENITEIWKALSQAFADAVQFHVLKESEFSERSKGERG